MRHKVRRRYEERADGQERETDAGDEKQQMLLCRWHRRLICEPELRWIQLLPGFEVA